MKILILALLAYSIGETVPSCFDIDAPFQIANPFRGEIIQTIFIREDVAVVLRDQDLEVYNYSSTHQATRVKRIGTKHLI